MSLTGEQIVAAEFRSSGGQSFRAVNPATGGDIKPQFCEATRDDIVAGLFYAQQVAMARQSAANPVRFVSDGVSTIDIQENGASIAGDGYPITLATGTAFPAATLNYDKLGRTTASLLALTNATGNVNITVESSGYAH